MRQSIQRRHPSFGDQFDQLFSPDEPGNKYEQLALSFIKEKTGKEATARELAAVVMYWNGMLARYQKQFPLVSLPLEFHVPSKEQLGLKWVKDVSSADGEPIIREWFPV